LEAATPGHLPTSEQAVPLFNNQFDGVLFEFFRVFWSFFSLIGHLACCLTALGRVSDIIKLQQIQVVALTT